MERTIPLSAREWEALTPKVLAPFPPANTPKPAVLNDVSPLSTRPLDKVAAEPTPRK